MAFLADPGVPCPSLSTRLASLFDRIEWPVVVPLVVVLATVLLQAALVAGEHTTSPDTGVCERRATLFLPALH